MKVKKSRTKKSPFLIEETFPPPHENVKLIIIGSLDDLNDLGGDYSENPEELGKLFLNHFIGGGVWGIINRFGFGNPPRGVHKRIWEFTQKMKIRAPYTFGLIDYWLKRPQEKWPEPIKKVIKAFEVFSIVPRSGKRKKPKAHEVTAYIMERDFGKEREKNNPSSNLWTDDPDGFKKTYISRSHFTNWMKIKLKDLEDSGIELSPTLPITTEKPSEAILSLFPNNHA